MAERWDALFDGIFDREFDYSDMAVRRETLRTRAAAARPHLVELARTGRPGDQELPTADRVTTEYGELADLIDSSPSYMGMVLGAIDFVGDELGEALLSPLVESAGSVGPSRGYFTWEYLGADRITNPGEKSSLTSGMKETWRGHLRETYAFGGWSVG